MEDKILRLKILAFKNKTLKPKKFVLGTKIMAGIKLINLWVFIKMCKFYLNNRKHDLIVLIRS